MSQMTAGARPLRAPRRGPAPTPLRVIPASIARSGNGAFAAMCITLLVGGLIALLLLNTALAQGSLVLSDLQRESARLADSASNLQEEVDRASATGALARRATELGMVRMNQRGYVDLRTGKVSGNAEPATKLGAFPIVTSPTPPSVTAKVKKILDSASKAAQQRSAAAGGAAPTTTQSPTPSAGASTSPSPATTTSGGAAPTTAPAPPTAGGQPAPTATR